jgi:predicted DsbA family dithiol-disulfide isomerase/uncharacterized membrane protein
VRPAFWLGALRLCALVALGASAALLVDYLSPTAAFCSPGSGCAAVRASGFGYLFGGRVPVPAIGIVGFALLFVVSLRPVLRPILHPIAWAGGATALVFVGLMALVLHEYCKLCLVADGAAVLGAIAAFLHKKSLPSGPDHEVVSPWAWFVIGGVAVAAPLMWPAFKPQPPVPAGIARYYQPGKINVVEFADFECPFCRKLHPVLKKLIEENGDKVRFVRLNMPLPQHAHALDAAKGAVCGEKLGKKEEMADRLFASEDLSPAGIRKVAIELGLNVTEFDACVVDPDTTARIERESQLLRDAGFQGLPTTFVGPKQLVGARSEEAFREAFAQAEHGDGAAGVPIWLFFGIAVIACGTIAYFGRVEPPAPEPPLATRGAKQG